MVEKSAFNSLETALVDIPAVSMPIARFLYLRHLWRCDRTVHVIVPSTRCTWKMIILFNQFLDICHTCQVDGLAW
jgi:hypothetical protein